MNNMLTCQLFEKKDLQFKMIVVAKWAGRIQIIMIVSAHCHGEWGDVITLPTSNSRGNVDKMWQCNKVGDGELGNIITSPTPKIIGNIGHWIWRWKYQHFWHDVAVHLYRKWWIGQCYYIAHCKNLTNSGHWIWRWKYGHFSHDVVLHIAGRCNVITSPTPKIIGNIGHWIGR